MDYAASSVQFRKGCLAAEYLSKVYMGNIS